MRRGAAAPRWALLAVGVGAALLPGAQAARVTCGTTLQQQQLEGAACDALKVEFPSSIWNAVLSPDTVAWTIEQCRVKVLSAAKPGSPIGIKLENNRRCWGFAQAASDFVNATDRSGGRGSDIATLPVANPASSGTTIGGDPLFLFTVLGTVAPAPSTAPAGPTTLAPTSLVPTTATPATSAPATSAPASSPFAIGPPESSPPESAPPGSQVTTNVVIAVLAVTVLAAGVFVVRRAVTSSTTSAKIDGEHQAGGPPAQAQAQATRLEHAGEVRESAISHTSFMSRVSSRMFSFVFVTPPAHQLSPAGDPRLLRGTMQSAL